VPGKSFRPAIRTKEPALQAVERVEQVNQLIVIGEWGVKSKEVMKLRGSEDMKNNSKNRTSLHFVPLNSALR
jgi:hypothetical protein